MFNTLVSAAAYAVFGVAVVHIAWDVIVAETWNNLKNWRSRP